MMDTLLFLRCLDFLAINYNSSANLDDGSCEYPLGGCQNDNYLEFDF